jgi:uncharacterized membrane protein
MKTMNKEKLNNRLFLPCLFLLVVMLIVTSITVKAGEAQQKPIVLKTMGSLFFWGYCH